MRLHEWDPSSAPDPVLRSWLHAINSALAADLPGDPRWSSTSLRGYLSVTMPGEHRISWIAEGPDPAPDILGYASVLLFNGLGVLELFVAPSARRGGVGRALLATVARRALVEGFGSLGVEVIGGTVAVPFYESAGFDLAFTEMRSLLDLSKMDWSQVDAMAGAVVTGYHIEYHPGGLPDELLPAYAEAKSARRLSPTGDLELRPSSYDPERLRTSLACLHARGLMPYIALAVHERTGKVAGLTEVVVPAQRPTRADQYDTVVVPEHRGYGLARALKARMLAELRSAQPQLRDVQTWQATGHEELHQVNEELGFKSDREWREYDADAAEVIRRLGRSL